MFVLFRKKKAEQPKKEEKTRGQEIEEIIEKNELWRGICDDDKINKRIELDLLNLEYREITNKAYDLSSYETNNRLYSKAINQKSIFNEYSTKYKELCEEYLVLVPQLIKYERKRIELVGFGSTSYCHRLLKQYILLLDKQEEYIKEAEIIHYLIGLGITEDGTKGGLNKRAEKLIPKIKEQRKILQIGEYKVNNETGEIIE